MTKNLLAFFTILTLACVCAGQFRCRRQLPLEKRCDNSPAEHTVDLSSWAGLWYQIGAGGSARRNTNFPCSTANYTLQSTSPLRINVLNCFYAARSPIAKPLCITGSAKTLAGGKLDSELQAQFDGRPASILLLQWSGFQTTGTKRQSCIRVDERKGNRRKVSFSSQWVRMRQCSSLTNWLSGWDVRGIKYGEGCLILRDMGERPGIWMALVHLSLLIQHHYHDVVRGSTLVGFYFIIVSKNCAVHNFSTQFHMWAFSLKL